MAIQLNKREKIAVWGAGIAIGLLIMGKLVIFPYLEAHEKWARQIETNKVTLLEMQALKADYKNFKQLSDRSQVRLEKRGEDFSLFSFINGVSDKAKINENITYMKPSTIQQKGSQLKVDVVEMRFSGVTLKQLMHYLHMVEKSGNQVFIKRAAISNSAKKKGYLDVTLLMETII
jgi:hypothetical protein